MTVRELHRKAQAERLRQLTSVRDTFLDASRRAIGISQVPEHVRREDPARDAGIVAGVFMRQAAMLVAPIERDALLQVLQRPGEIAAPVERVAEDVVSDQAQRGSLEAWARRNSSSPSPRAVCSSPRSSWNSQSPRRTAKSSGLSPSCRHSSRALLVVRVPLRVSRDPLWTSAPGRGPSARASSRSKRSRLLEQLASGH